MTESIQLALIADLVASRQSPERAALQDALGELLERLNFEQAQAFAAPMVQTAGDELQALLHPLHAEHALTLVREVSDALFGRRFQQRVVFGLGLGTLSTGPLPTDGAAPNVALLDGPCFHRARAALEEAQRTSRWAIVKGFARSGFHAHLDELLSMHFELVGTLRQGWTPLQAHYAAAVRRELSADGRGAQKRVAEIESVNPSVISESLKASHFDVVLRAEQLLATLLSESAVAALMSPEPLP
ncbi:MAG: hypothetical protein DHS20C15_05140 [Planctomycetota bacterium]|nr:MAG: hypothetical protein DHS20C15_05140 [Planctomycetota bacterium]